MSVQPGVSIRHWSGPLAMLVDMARRRRVDLRAIPMVELLSDCLESLHQLSRMEDRADQLLLAADLIAMKARLLTGDPDRRDQEENALRLQALKLLRIQRVAALLLDRDQLGCDVWARGAPELEADQTAMADGDITLIEIIRAYARLRLRENADAPMELHRILAMSLREALEALGSRVEELDEWTELFGWAGRSARGLGVTARSQAAASFAAALEMARRGEVEIRQSDLFGEITVGRGERAPPPPL